MFADFSPGRYPVICTGPAPPFAGFFSFRQIGDGVGVVALDRLIGPSLAGLQSFLRGLGGNQTFATADQIRSARIDEPHLQ
ncbi:hypothetical protein FRUB_07469 [Fimbriiglobus ruber]|uniref:Uncharacterized protein n=1 Tax=Fimbriiglobus ruber TaxID=1908690 RepID=A0A225DMA6_9BACT|nr:hypothetical protein FRUB_07469 [Fimbriiglobus ruber]